MLAVMIVTCVCVAAVQCKLGKILIPTGYCNVSFALGIVIRAGKIPGVWAMGRYIDVASLQRRTAQE